MSLKSSTYRLLCLALALALALTLGGCGKKGGFLGVADLLADGAEMPSPDKDPAGFLWVNGQNTLAALKDRYAGSPLAALGDLRAESGVLSLQAAQGQAPGAVSAKISFDRRAGRIGLEAATVRGRVLLYADSGFFGVSLPEITGGSFYGFAPEDVFERASDSALGALLEEDALASLKELEGLLDAARAAPGPSPEEAEKCLKEALRELLDAAQVTVEPSTVAFGGQETDGCILTVEADSAAMAAFRERLGRVFPGLEAALASYGADAGAASPAAPCRGVFVANGCLTSLSLSFPGGDGSTSEIALDFFTEQGETLTLTRAGETAVLKSRPSDKQDRWSHTLTLERGGAISVLSTALDGDQLTLSLDSPQKSGSISGALRVTDSGFTFDNALIRSGGASSGPLTVSFAAGGSVEKPTDTVDIFSLSETELSALLVQAYTALSRDAAG